MQKLGTEKDDVENYIKMDLGGKVVNDLD
jgi:hypothetical protein